MVDMDGSARADEGQKARGIRVVGIDPDSYDHHQLTLAEFPEGTGLEYVHCAYPHIPAAVAKGEVDAAVWNRTMLSIPLELVGVAVRPLLREDAISLSRSLNHAVLLTRGTRPEIGTLLGRINRKSVTEIQSRVLSQEILPMY
jgi:predicted solute-binding protein